MDSLKKSVGEKIFSFRKKHKPRLTRERLSELISVDPTTIYRWEKGISYPEAKYIERLAKALNVSPQEIISEENPTIEALTEIIKRQEFELANMKSADEAFTSLKNNPTLRELVRIAGRLTASELRIVRDQAEGFLRRRDPAGAAKKKKARGGK